MKLFDADAIGETILRRLAGRTSRRGILSRAGLKVTRRKIEMVVLDHLIGE